MSDHPTKAVQAELDRSKSDCVAILQTMSGLPAAEAQRLVDQVLKVSYRIISNQQTEIERLRRQLRRLKL